MQKKRLNLFKLVIILFLLVYAGSTFVRQEVEINKYAKEEKSYIDQIALAKEKNIEYKQFSEYVKTDEYIERIARDKLGMLLPEEKIYIEYNS